MSYITVEVEVNTSEFSDEDIRREYEYRGLGEKETGEDIQILYDKYATGKNIYPELLEMFLEKANRIV